MKKLVVLGVVLLGCLGSFVFIKYRPVTQTVQKETTKAIQQFQSANPAALNDPLQISTMRERDYPGSIVTIEQTLPDGANYHQYIASYRSERLKIYALLTIPTTQMPKGGYPIIVFNHGYIPPEIYRTTERYIAYVDAFARNGYVVFKSDYRGNGNSEGKPEGAYYSPAYTTDDLNAIASIKGLSTTSITCTTGTTSVCDMFKISHTAVNPNKVGVWGHSMGGNITLRDLVVRPNWIRAAVIWGGVVGSYSDLLNWHDPTYHPSDEEQAIRRQSRSKLLQIYGTPQSNPTFWNSIDPTYFEKDITAPVQLDVGEADEEVPPKFSKDLYTNLKNYGKTVEIYRYPGADHNISQSLDLALGRSVEFFDKFLK